ncbi:zinc-binding domain-containing protein [Nemania sp. FL0916]|nr:zinc-binding domain-containing protein [Nemania sp. FL0916]
MLHRTLIRAVNHLNTSQVIVCCIKLGRNYTMAKKQRKAPPKWSLHPAKHPEVSRLLEDDDLDFTFHSADDDHGYIESADSSVMGRFRCHNPNCESKGWSSKKIAITVRMYSNREYNARVYHQRCQHCSGLGRPILDDTYAERVTYRLKKWSGVYVEAPPYSNDHTKPHHRDLCEGCKAGRCKRDIETDDV